MGLGDLNNETEEGNEDTGDGDVIDVEPTETTETVSQTGGGGGLLTPASDIDDVVSLYEQFEDIKTNLLNSDDTQNIGSSVHVKKSGWRKIATAFNVSVDVKSQDTYVEDGILKASVTATAEAPNGKSATSIGFAGSNEANFMEKIADDDAGPDRAREIAKDKFGAEPDDVMFVDGYWRWLKPVRQVKEHNVVTLASTRAKNRAISDCVGGGEVSAEEITADDVL